MGKHLQTLTLASDEVASLLHENTVFWMGSMNELRMPHVQQLAPCGVPSLAIVLPLAADAMKVLSASPGTDAETIVASVVDGIEALEAHREAAEARFVSEEALLRHEQDLEFNAALAADQAAEKKRRCAAEADASETPSTVGLRARSCARGHGFRTMRCIFTAVQAEYGCEAFHHNSQKPKPIVV